MVRNLDLDGFFHEDKFKMIVTRPAYLAAVGRRLAIKVVIAVGSREACVKGQRCAILQEDFSD